MTQGNICPNLHKSHPEIAAQTPAAETAAITTISADATAVNTATTAAIQMHCIKMMFLSFFSDMQIPDNEINRLVIKDECNDNKSNTKIIDNGNDNYKNKNSNNNNNNNKNNNNNNHKNNNSNTFNSLFSIPKDLQFMFERFLYI